MKIVQAGVLVLVGVLGALMYVKMNAPPQIPVAQQPPTPVVQTVPETVAPIAPPTAPEPVAPPPPPLPLYRNPSPWSDWRVIGVLIVLLVTLMLTGSLVLLSRS